MSGLLAWLLVPVQIAAGIVLAAVLKRLVRFAWLQMRSVSAYSHYAAEERARHEHGRRYCEIVEAARAELKRLEAARRKGP